MSTPTSIWLTLPRTFLALAPMEGVTDPVFRQVVARAGRPDLFFTEFTNVSSFASEKGRTNALERLAIAPTDPPIIAQIWGKNPDHFALLAAELENLGFAGLDLNMGCPDRHVNKAGGGAAMILTPDLACDCIARARAATRLPVSVKTRLGFTSVDEFPAWLTLLFEQNLAALTVHLRTRKEMSKVPAHFELIPDILKLRAKISPETKLIINGDIKDRAHAELLAQKYPEIDGFMIGRGVFQNPFCFAPVNLSKNENSTPANSARNQTATPVDAPTHKSPATVDAPTHKSPVTPAPVPPLSEKTPLSPNYTTDSGKSQEFSSQPPRREDLLTLLRLHLDLYDAQAAKLARAGSRYPFDPLKHFFKIYINNFPGASDLRARLMTCTTTAEVRATLAQEGY